MRSFVAVDFNMELKKEILKLQSQLKGMAFAGRWKYIDNFHLTLKFLGEIEKSRVENIKKGLEEVCSGIQRFCLNIDGLDFFPGNNCLRVLWLRLGGDLQQLHKLQSEIDIMLESLGFEREKRRYIPHVTIAQDVKFNTDFENIKGLVESDRFAKIEVRSVNLFKSEQISNKRVYTPITEHNLI
ncbi:RNA 2',3'-cyclic phosphodiesterase [Acetivibrio mesophilus]|uniref:RNA 2',3'-cyclic phosphodiesterase n=1 Tax=Acetivibrio mesophilus TaxID=2487273 RepID=A0A4Q0IAX4_9FIRM|nr:RNA 2',3'-cyclic phosphodiesterase [Acetivibrio mesophilus]ODM25647.1 2'-5' RNA ligase [Clostridium sp. Bc-iso-3]RXE60232.1 RNA 2',3'-cyclic phosphodiesterase [Acetivibrio mesophilus]HHV29899.1 RNA 2',3'-cyclic phosphodiesterase [Clostridium sp.]